MSVWFWRVIALNSALIITCFVSYMKGEDALQKLPFCNPNAANGASANEDLVLVSTLDGKLTAFSTENGIKAWDIQTQPLLSSNLHHVELTSGGKWVRLVPSLRGTLYSVSGDTVEPLPFSAEQLLSSSFKYSDDLVIAGSRETLWMGIDAARGTVVYECGTRGCSGDKEGYGSTLLALSRLSSTVRALDPRSGEEKWNFSVAEHHLGISGGDPDCAPEDEETPLQYSVKVAPENGLAVCKADEQLVWQHKLEAPVAGMWRLRSGTLQTIDVLWAATKGLSNENYVQTTPPSLYIGLHNQQLYIQEGALYLEKLENGLTAPNTPWRLKNTRPLIAGPETSTALQHSDPNSLSLITLYGNTGKGGNFGFFLYQEETCDQSIQTDENLLGPEIISPNNQPPNTIEHHHVHVHVYSLWFWWKEVLLIVISSTLLMNLMIWPRFFAPRFRAVSQLPSGNKEYIVVEKHYDRKPSLSGEYCGRYETDFTPLRCLGRGGFGVVFEARNNIDHCSYAVKRITLPRRESKRERVLREVRALAKLEHENIVRYFNAWLEEPPPQWQEQRDMAWMRDLDGVSLAMSEDYTSPQTKSPPFLAIEQANGSNKDSIMNLHKDDLAVMDSEGKLSVSKRLRSRSCNDSFSIVFDDDASKHPQLTSKSINSLKHSLDITSDLDIPPNLSLNKNLGSGDNDDSFIIFANSDDNHNSKGFSEARNDLSTARNDLSENRNDLSEARNDVTNRQLERVKECDGYDTQDSPSPATKKKKKGHTRHWSLDMCVKTKTEEAHSNARAHNSCKMYLYIQMQLCLRDSLHDWLRHNRTYEARAHKVTTLFSQIVSAVEYVHLAGLIHRDLKPSNIFFAPDGRVKVGDFGLVTAMSDSSQDGDEPPAHIDIHTRHTYRVGTHLYMSPEQLRGRPYGYKVDIYSLGLILFELLQPFGTEAERVGCLLKLREGAYPNCFVNNYPEEMEVLKMMLSEDPSLRPTASGVKARAPLHQTTDERWHFTLPSLVS